MLSERTRLPVAEREQALPRTYVVHDVITVGNAEEALQRVRSPEFQPRVSAVVVAPAAPILAPLVPAAWEYAQILDTVPMTCPWKRDVSRAAS